MESKSVNEWLILVANLGVVAGLVLVAYEVNQANVLAETQAYTLRLDQMQMVRQVNTESEYLPHIYLKLSESGVESLSEIERFRLRNWEEGVLLRMQSHYYQYLQGYLDRNTGEQILKDAAGRLTLWQDLDIEIEGGSFRQLVEGTTRNES